VSDVNEIIQKFLTQEDTLNRLNDLAKESQAWAVTTQLNTKQTYIFPGRQGSSSLQKRESAFSRKWWMQK